MSLKRLLPAIALLALAAPAEAAISVGTFLDKVAGLKAQGVGALVSPDFALLRTEAQAATAELKADREARKAAGKPPIACVPEGQSIGIMDMIDGLSALPPAARRLPLKDGYAMVLRKKFPC